MSLVSFIVLFVFFWVVALLVFLYLKAAFSLLKAVREKYPDIWKALGEPETVSIHTGGGVTFTISPLFPFLRWIIIGDSGDLKLETVYLYRRTKYLFFAALCALVIHIGLFFMFYSQGTGAVKKPTNPYVGKMNDYSYSGHRGQVRRPNAYGDMVCVEDFAGRFVWSAYVAPWCDACPPQSQVVKSLEDTFSNNVVFLTVITSINPEYDSKATPQIAKDWAGRFQLDPRKVVAADLWSMIVPQHILFSPKGQTLYRVEGFLSAEQIRQISSRYIEDWNNWSSNGKVSEWMRTE